MRRTLALLLTLAVLTGAACGKSSKKTASSTSTTAAAAGGSSATTEANFSGKGSKEFCTLAKKIQDQFSSRNLQTTDPAALKKSFQDAGTALDALAKAAPSEIKADVATIQKAFTPFLQALANANYDPTKISPADQAKLASISSPEVEAASTRLDQYGVKVCGFAPTNGSVPTTAP